MSALRLKKPKPKLEEYTSARRAPHKNLVSKLTKTFNGPKDTSKKAYEPMSSSLWRPSVLQVHDASVVTPAKKNEETPKKKGSWGKLVSNITKDKVKKHEKLPQGFDEEKGFLEDYQNMDMNTFLDDDDEEGHGIWKWFVVMLVFFFVLVAYLLRVWGQRESLDSINN